MGELRKYFSDFKSKYPDYQLDTRASDLQQKETFQIRQQAIELKELLSVEEESDLLLESVFGCDYLLDETIEREVFSGWLKTFLVKIENALDDALFDADLEPENIDRVILVGGTSNIPVIKQKVRDYFGKEPQEPQQSGQLALMVGEGAGIYCGLKYVEKSLDCKISVGVSKDVALKWKGKFIVMLPRNTLYGESSELVSLTIPNPGKKDAVIPIVQGNPRENDKIAGIPVSVKVQQQLHAGILGVKLNTDENNGTIGYELYSDGKLLESGKAGEE